MGAKSGAPAYPAPAVRVVKTAAGRFAARMGVTAFQSSLQAEGASRPSVANGAAALGVNPIKGTGCSEGGMSTLAYSLSPERPASAAPLPGQILGAGGQPALIGALAAVFTLMSGLIIATAGLLRGALRELDEAARRQDATNAELQHRVKNTLAVVQALASETGRSADTFDGFYADFRERLLALASAHNLLSSAGWTACELSSLARESLRSLRPGFASRGVLLRSQRSRARPWCSPCTSSPRTPSSMERSRARTARSRCAGKTNPSCVVSSGVNGAARR